MTVEIADTVSFNVRAYFSLTASYRKIIQLLADMTLHAVKKGWKGVWLKIKKIATLCGGISERTVQRFIEAVNGIFMTITSRFCDNGRQTTNDYKFHEGFWKALAWLSQRNLLDADESRHHAIVEEAKIWEEKAVSPSPSSRECHPYIKTLISTHIKRGFVHPKLEKVGNLSEEYKKFLSKQPENLLMLALEDACKSVKKVLWPGGFLWNRINFYRKRQHVAKTQTA